MRDLDILIADAASSSAAALDGIEAGVWSRVARLQARRDERRLRATALGVAAMIGGLTGGITTAPIDATQGELAIFSPRVALMPLHLGGAAG